MYITNKFKMKILWGQAYLSMATAEILKILYQNSIHFSRVLTLLKKLGRGGANEMRGREYEAEAS